MSSVKITKIMDTQDTGSSQTNWKSYGCLVQGMRYTNRYGRDRVDQSAPIEHWWSFTHYVIWKTGREWTIMKVNMDVPALSITFTATQYGNVFTILRKYSIDAPVVERAQYTVVRNDTLYDVNRIPSRASASLHLDSFHNRRSKDTEAQAAYDVGIFLCELEGKEFWEENTKSQQQQWDKQDTQTTEADEADHWARIQQLQDLWDLHDVGIQG